MQQKRQPYVIRHSCITGQAVWIYRGPSKEAERKAYRRACQKELVRVDMRGTLMDRRRQNIMRMLDACMASVPVTAELSPEQRAAARQLRAISEKKTDSHSDFYDHIMEERRRRGNR